MDYYPNYYGLLFVSSAGQSNSLKDIFVNSNPSAQKLVDNLRSDKTVGGHYGDTLIISSPDILDFFSGDLGPFAEKIIHRFPSKNIFATYYNSVTSQRGICQIVNSKVDIQIYTDEPGENNIDMIEQEYLQKHFGHQLPSLLGLDIEIVAIG